MSAPAIPDLIRLPASFPLFALTVRRYDCPAVLNLPVDAVGRLVATPLRGARNGEVNEW